MKALLRMPRRLSSPRHFFGLIALAALAVGLQPTWASTQGELALAPAAVQLALDDFARALDERWSYRHANRADFAAAIAAVRTKAAAGTSVDALGLELHKIVALGIDGHSGVDGYRLPGSRFLPFLVEPIGGRFVAFTSDRTAFLADGFPYLLQLDGKNIREWCDRAAVLVPRGSPQYVRHRSLRLLRNLDFVRREMGMPTRDSVEVVVASSDGARRRTITLPTATALLAYGVWPTGGSRIEGGVGYLRLKNMVAATSVQEIKEWMPRFRETTGLIIDVRDNNGGDRDALMWLYSFLAAPGDPPRVINAAVYRLHPAHPSDHLAANHRMYRLDAREWSDAQRRAIAEFARTFKPWWEPPAGHFSDWHYMALVPQDDPAVYHYTRPVIVLMNGNSFSATDSFLAGLKGMKNVTLLGEPSAGGSAYTQTVTLGATPLRLRIGSMVSFQGDGRLFDGHGVAPDGTVEPTPEYYIGGADVALAEALKRVKARARDAADRGAARGVRLPRRSRL